MDTLPIGEFAFRAGVAPSALRYYENRGLIRAARTTGNQRRYERSELRRVAFIRVAQQVGLSLDEITAALAELPESRTPTKADWAKLSKSWHERLTDQIKMLEGLRDDLTGCIGCGCLSLKRCSLYNAGDKAAERGSGANFLIKQAVAS